MSRDTAALAVEVVLVLALVGLLVAVLYRFISFCLADLAAAPAVRGLPRDTWRILIAVVIPIGGLLWLAFGRPDRHGT